MNELKYLRSQLWERHPREDRERPTAFCHQCFDRGLLPAEDLVRYRDLLLEHPEDMETAPAGPDWTAMWERFAGMMQGWLYGPSELGALLQTRGKGGTPSAEAEPLHLLSWTEGAARFREAASRLEEELAGSGANLSQVREMADWLDDMASLPPESPAPEDADSRGQCLLAIEGYIRDAAQDWKSLGGASAPDLLAAVAAMRLLEDKA